jgi:hypothetical protein
LANKLVVGGCCKPFVLKGIHPTLTVEACGYV